MYAQFSTDLAIQQYFPKNYQGRYLDLGGSYPIIDSNTYLFYQSGWRGIVVEPINERYEEHRRVRPRDICINAAASDRLGYVDLYAASETSVSSVVPEQAEAMTGRGVPYEVRKVQCGTVLDMLAHAFVNGDVDAYKPVDFVSIDVEGHEYEVLSKFPFRYPRPYDHTKIRYFRPPMADYKPRMFVVESCIPCTEIPNYDKWEHLLLDQGYHFVQQCGVNRIYLR